MFENKEQLVKNIDIEDLAIQLGFRNNFKAQSNYVVTIANPRGPTLSGFTYEIYKSHD